MSGKLCPNCKKLTFYKTNGENRKCTNCGYEMFVPIDSKGRGSKCPNCGRLTVHDQNGKSSCTNCGATFKLRGGKTNE
jgi:DNA-directed RNA polymerase subunit M/transcription elongation factor TFIIS